MMKLIKIVFLFASLFIFASCTSNQAYEALQQRNKIECQKLPPAEYDKCMANTNTDYQTYEKQRKELESTNPNH